MSKKIFENQDIEQVLVNIINKIHKDGPIHSDDFEKLAYIKKYYNEIITKYEMKLLSTMGLFYKTKDPEGILGEIYSIYEDVIKEEIGRVFTPVQAHAYLHIRDKRYFSFSAPTSAGKSYLFRELIQDVDYDIVIVVPSRALIAEYIDTINDLVDTSVLVLPFIENVNITKAKRRIFVITPERGVDLFKIINEFNIKLVLLDEAQISEENIRGMKFDAFVRRIDKVLPDAKKVFAHPFVSNPEAQLLKHNMKDSSSYKTYEQHTVGKIFVSYENNEFMYFSPYQSETKRFFEKLDRDIAKDVLIQGGTLLIYIAKSKIYDGRYIANFAKYIELCDKINDPDAIKLIEKLKKFIGSNETDKYSLLIDMMERGIVIHHGSMPLHARLIMEDFIKSKYARICFATGTLIQGINMPFDVVWIDNFHNLPTLSLKNLIGRAGRTTSSNRNFEFGYTIVKRENINTFCTRMNDIYLLNVHSKLDQDLTFISDDEKDIVEAVKDGTFHDDLHLTNLQVERLQKPAIEPNILFILNNLLIDDTPISGKDYYNLDDTKRKKIKNALQNIYLSHLRRTELTRAEKAVLSTAIPIMLWHIQGKSFSEIVSLRHAFLTEKDKVRNIMLRLKSKELTPLEAQKQIELIPIRYSPVASPLPDSNLQEASIFPRNLSIEKFDYDTLVYDTYDYLDKVISLSLVDPICGAFQLYYDKTNDSRALSIKNYIRYGTNNDTEIWLLRYGFSFEDIEWILHYIDFIDENAIVFKKSITELTTDKYNIISRYI